MDGIMQHVKMTVPQFRQLDAAVTRALAMVTAIRHHLKIAQSESDRLWSNIDSVVDQAYTVSGSGCDTDSVPSCTEQHRQDADLRKHVREAEQHVLGVYSDVCLMADDAAIALDDIQSDIIGIYAQGPPIPGCTGLVEHSDGTMDDEEEEEEEEEDRLSDATDVVEHGSDADASGVDGSLPPKGERGAEHVTTPTRTAAARHSPF
jgi:hypothetical protein